MHGYVQSPWVAALRPEMPVPASSDHDIKALEELLKQGVRVVGTYDGTDDGDLECPLRHEVALIGRSNVGKSSLLNALARRPDLAATSRTPGRTTHVSFYGLGKAHAPIAAIVDMPGYGYAKRAQKLQNHWISLMGQYLENRPRSVLRRVVQLVDARLAVPGGAAGISRLPQPAGSSPARSGKPARERRGRVSAAELAAAELTAELSAAPAPMLTHRQRVRAAQGTLRGEAALGRLPLDMPLVSSAPDDCEAAQMLEAVGAPWLLVLTKADLLSPAERSAAVAALRPLAERPNGPLPVVHLVSARTGEGVAELRGALAGAAGWGPLPGTSRLRAVTRRHASQQAEAAEAAAGEEQLRALGLDPHAPVLPLSTLDRVRS